MSPSQPSINLAATLLANSDDEVPIPSFFFFFFFHPFLVSCDSRNDVLIPRPMISRLYSISRSFSPRCSSVTCLGAAMVQTVQIPLLRGLTSLQYLNLSWCKSVTDSGITHLGSLTALQQLRLH
jgi:hypothetical protein